MQHEIEEYNAAQCMKMIMPLQSAAAGTIHYRLPLGATMKAGELIAQLDLEDADAVTMARPFTGGFPDLGPPEVYSQSSNDVFKHAYNAAEMILAGEC